MARKNQPPVDQAAPEILGIDGGLGFLGNHPVSLDDKWRITVPARFKAIMYEKYATGSEPLRFVVTLSLDEHRNASVYPLPEWKRFLEQFQRLPALDRHRRDLMRLITSLASVVEMDGQGRIRLDKKIVERTKLSKRVVVVGCEDHYEVWDEQRFDDFIDKAIGHIDNLTDSAMEQLKGLSGGATPIATLRP